MAIAGYAIGASQGYIYIRAEYPIAVAASADRHRAGPRAGACWAKISWAPALTLISSIRLGAGAFVCGEETALMTSIEGHRGEPRPRPPFPAVKGLFGKPTMLNNVETYANVPQIILQGRGLVRVHGHREHPRAPRCLPWAVRSHNTGLVEIPMGTTLREIVEEIGGGIPNGKKFKAAQTGGPSGGCIPASHIDTPIDYDNLIAIGQHDGLRRPYRIWMRTPAWSISPNSILEFTVDESCGKCTPCRIGTRRLLEFLEKITSGNGEEEDLDKIDELCQPYAHRQPLRTGPDRAEPGALDDEVLPR